MHANIFHLRLTVAAPICCEKRLQSCKKISLPMWQSLISSAASETYPLKKVPPLKRKSALLTRYVSVQDSDVSSCCYITALHINNLKLFLSLTGLTSHAPTESKSWWVQYMSILYVFFHPFPHSCTRLSHAVSHSNRVHSAYLELHISNCLSLAESFTVSGAHWKIPEQLYKALSVWHKRRVVITRVHGCM